MALCSLAWLAVWSAIAAPAPAPSEPAGSVATSPAVSPADEDVRHTVVLDGAVTQAPVVLDELSLRLADRPVSVAGPNVPRPAAPLIWVEVATTGEGAAIAVAQIRLIVSDGRAFERTIEVDTDQFARGVAGAVANMVDAIEGNRLAPAQTGVALPPMPESDPPAASQPSTPPTQDPPRTQDPPPPPDPPSLPPAAWLGVVLGPAAAFGVGRPTDAAGVTGLGGQIAAQLRHRAGAVASLGVRVMGWRTHGLRIVRTRVSALGGYAVDFNRFELLAAMGPTVAFARLGSSLVTPGGRRHAIAPLLGGLALVRPSYTVAMPRRTLLVKVGAQLELSGAVEARTPPGAVQIFDAGPDPEAIARLGGLELAAALVLDARFALGER